MNKSKVIPLTLFVFALVILSLFAFKKGYSSTTNSSNNAADYKVAETTQDAPTQDTSSAVTDSSAQTFTMSEVSSHTDRSSCYSVISGNVYDLTDYIDRHPAGPQDILRICGKDGTSDFNAEHGRNTRIESQLSSFKIGTLSD